MFDYPADFGKDPSKYHIEYMSPDDYLAKVGYQQLPGMIHSNCKDYSNPYCQKLLNIKSREDVIKWEEELLQHKGHDKQVKDLARDISKNGLKCIPYLDKKKQSQEGRHRALALRRLGVDKIPVMIAED
jgi:hypothetical protein